ncbi:MAG: DUF488 family protein [Leucobacter sp.]|jgi:uncharacterized protein YeaO (DUF488 family)|nr:DUF488 family protein [Leucobacter sp.]
MDVQIKRAYDTPASADGIRVLVDRLWPRGLSKQAAELDLWLKEVAPSAELRRAWHADPQGHDPRHFASFAKNYRAELTEPPASIALTQLVQLAHESDTLTLVYGARDEQINHAVVLQQVVREQALG